MRTPEQLHEKYSKTGRWFKVTYEEMRILYNSNIDYTVCKSCNRIHFPDNDAVYMLICKECFIKDNTCY